MNEIITLLLAFAEGAILGAFFFGGLFWTIKRGLLSKHPAVWFLGSLLLRMSATLGGFYFVSHGNWQRLLLCLAGFFIVGTTAKFLSFVSGEKRTQPVQEAINAS